MSKTNLPVQEAIFYCSYCHKPRRLKQMSNKTFDGKPMCKKCARNSGFPFLSNISFDKVF
jgi:DNA replicative helicase MCM subunit Mcm2 (Cdc46/Mcm family)